MTDVEKIKRMSNELKIHYESIVEDVKHVLLQLEIIHNREDAVPEFVENNVISYTIDFKILHPQFFNPPLLIIINPLHNSDKRELRVTVLEGQDNKLKMFSFDELETGNMEKLDDDNVFDIEEHMFIVDLHTKLSELKYKVLAESAVRK